MGGAKLATREGNIVYLDDLFSEASKRVLDIINEKNPDMEDKEQKAQEWEMWNLRRGRFPKSMKTKCL